MVARDTKTIVGLYFEINITSEIYKALWLVERRNFTSLCFIVRPGANHKPIVLTIPARRFVNICKQSLHRHHVFQCYNWDGRNRALSFLHHSCHAHIYFLVQTPSLFRNKAEKGSSLSVHISGRLFFCWQFKHREVTNFLFTHLQGTEPDQTQALVKFWNQGRSQHEGKYITHSHNYFLFKEATWSNSKSRERD